MRLCGPIIFLMVFMSTPTISQTLVSADDPAIFYMGRVDCSFSGKTLFDWPGITMQTNFTGTSCGVVIEGVNCFDAFVDGMPAATFQSRSGKGTFVVASRLADRSHRLLLVKRSESVLAPSSFHGLLLDANRTVSAPPALPERKIEFIGDSYTAGFANEYPSRECPVGKDDSIILATTNTNKAFGPLAARAFGAQYHIIAISGKGLVRNYNGIDKGKELLSYYDLTLLSSAAGNTAAPRWDFSRWKADVAVISIGINDFQAEPPYADSARFDAVYLGLIERLRRQYPGVRIICCATRVWPTDALIPHVKALVGRQTAAGRTDIRYFEFATANGALYGHPNVDDHRNIAEGLIPVIAAATGWRRTYLTRGK